MEKFDHKRVNSSFLKMNTDGVPENIFFQKKVVITGDLDGYDRNVVASIFQLLGADVNTTISKTTEFVLIGKAPGPSKMDKIIDLIYSGKQIQLINERIFSELIEPYKEYLKIS